MVLAARHVSAPADTPESEEAHRSAYNAVFWDLGFKWQWDGATYRELCSLPEERMRIRAYIERFQPHLFRAYDADFLVDLIYQGKVRRHNAMVAAREAGQPLNLSCNPVKG